jgi:hypothetical protein
MPLPWKDEVDPLPDMELIRTPAERRVARREHTNLESLIARQQARLPELGFSAEQVELLHVNLKKRFAVLTGRLEAYKALSGGEVDVEVSLSGLGTRLVQLRVASGMTQRELAKRLGVNDTQVSRDERTVYAGVTLKRAVRVLEALGYTADVTIQPLPTE